MEVILVMLHQHGLLPQEIWMRSIQRRARPKEEDHPEKHYYVGVRLLINCKVIKTAIADCELDWFISPIS